MYIPKYTKIHGKISVRSHAERIIKKFVLIVALFSFSACGQKNAENTDFTENVAIIGKTAETPAIEPPEKTEASEAEAPAIELSENPAEASKAKTPEETPPQEAVESEKVAATGDEVLKTMKISIQDIEYTLEAVGKKEDNGYGIREILICKGEKLQQSILMEEAIEKDGVDGIDMGYTQCYEKEEVVTFRDVNFDGYKDLEVCGWMANNSIPYYYWCYNPDTKQYDYAFCLQLTEIDEQNERLISQCREEYGVYSTSCYKVDDENKLVLIETKIEDHRNEDAKEEVGR